MEAECLRAEDPVSGEDRYEVFTLTHHERRNAGPLRPFHRFGQ